MKKLMMMLALLAIPFAMQAQTQYHDIELNEATGPVKKMIVNVMGYDQVTTFSKEGKMEREGMSEAVYDADGYLQSAKMQMMGQEMKVSYKWENGKVASQTMNMMGRDVTSKRTYNDKGAVATESIDMDGQAMSTSYTDYKYDDHGNWISRKVSMMGQEMEQNRTIEYYE
ncbi:MAG: hypothetical protein IKH86_03640 [Prevotella sp.]|nr:hypothetical protein [Prevotella sp.]